MCQSCSHRNHTREENVVCSSKAKREEAYEEAQSEKGTMTRGAAREKRRQSPSLEFPAAKRHADESVVPQNENHAVNEQKQHDAAHRKHIQDESRSEEEQNKDARQGHKGQAQSQRDSLQEDKEKDYAEDETKQKEQEGTLKEKATEAGDGQGQDDAEQRVDSSFYDPNRVKNKIGMSARDLCKYVPQNAKSLEVYLNEETQLVNIEDISNEKIDDNEDYVIVAVLYRVVHHRHDVQDGAPEKGQYDKSTRGRKPSKEYDRMFMFGGIEGDMFAYIATNENNGRLLVCHLKDNVVGLGKPFVIINPEVKARSMMKNDMSTIITHRPMIPLSESFYRHFPTKAARVPSSAGEDALFVYHHLSIKLSKIKVICKHCIDKVVCRGCLCDRKAAFEPNQGCGCFDVTGGCKLSPVVLEYTVNFPRGIHDLRSVAKERSLRSTYLFLKNPTTLGRLDSAAFDAEHRKITKSVVKCVDHINSVGGFTVVGTIALGRVQDSSGAPQSHSTATLPTLHVTYLYPTDNSVADDKEYCNLKYKYEPPNEPGIAAAV